MKVKLLVSRCGPMINDAAGDVVTVSADEGGRMIAAGQAVEHKVNEKRPRKEAIEKAVK